MRFNRSILLASAALTLLATAACGSLSGDTSDPSTLGVIHGTLASQFTTPLENLATSIVWLEASSDGVVHETSDSVPVAGSFPASFTINLTSPPPAAAMMDLGADSGNPAGAGIHFAIGFLIAYDDANKNGQLDLVSAGTSSFVDQVEGVTSEMVVYADAAIPLSFATSRRPGSFQIGIDGSTPQAGYNLLSNVDNYCYAFEAATDVDGGPGGDANNTSCIGGVTWHPIDTPVTLNLGFASGEDKAVDQSFMCSSGPAPTFSTTSSPSCTSSGPCPSKATPATFGGPLPAASDQGVTCFDADNFTYVNPQDCTTTVTADACQQITTVCTSAVTVTLDPGDGSHIAAPADWPCTLQPPPSPVYLSSQINNGNAASLGDAGSGG